MTLTGSVILGFSNPIAGANYNLAITQGGVGGYTVTFPTVKWIGGGSPSFSSIVGDTDIFTFLYDGTDYYGSWTLAYS
jgi:hypothetical protein